MDAVVRSRIEDGVGVLTLSEVDRRNVLSPKLVEQARAVHRDFIERGLRAAVLEADGEGFCSGRDTQVVRVPGIPPAGAIFIDEIDNSPLAWVAAVDGDVVGAGIHLVTTCMHVVAGPNARFRVPELLDGLYPRPVAADLARIIGPRRTMTMMLTADALGPADAVLHGLAGESVGEGEVTARALERARTLAGLEPELLQTARAGWLSRFGTAPAADGS